MKLSASDPRELEMDDLTGRRGPGVLTRRNALLLFSATVMTSPGSVAQPARRVIVPRSLNNVMIAVSDLERSTAFYQRLFGTPVRHGEALVFRVGGGPQFFALTAVRSGAKPGFLSYGMTVEDFDAERVMRTLADHGGTGAQITQRGDTPELFILDANGIKVQLQDVAYGHGSGPKGDVFPPAPAPIARPNFQLRTINHVTLTVANGPRQKEFYQTAFGLPLHHAQGTTVGFGIEEFDAERVMATLIDHGLEPIEVGIPALIKPRTNHLSFSRRKPLQRCIAPHAPTEPTRAAGAVPARPGDYGSYRRSIPR
jgi:catechol 2,3-dioxygenase-like lactoylglutathione lyase family enzyme